MRDLLVKFGFEFTSASDIQPIFPTQESSSTYNTSFNEKRQRQRAYSMPSLSRPLSWRRWRRRQSIRTIATRQRRRRRPRAASKPNIAAARATSSGAPAARAAVAAAAFAAFASAVREITVLVCYTSATLLHYTHSLASFVSIERRSARRLSLARSLACSPPLSPSLRSSVII